MGGGPIGLFLGISLQQVGISCIILEKRSKLREGSRSIGIHPVSLELFDQLGITPRFLDQGLIIKKGHAYSSSGKLGTLSFENCKKPHNYILTIPQHQTEQILQNKLRQTNAVLQKSASITDVIEKRNGVTIRYQHDECSKTVTASYLIGCDGKESYVRNQAGISFIGKDYDDTYIMGDFTDNTRWGSDAAICLCNNGLIESFPLPGQKRRWVVKTDHYYERLNQTDIEELVKSRLGHNLSESENDMLSSFGVQKYVAENMVKGHTVLAGDAAHVVSPIGGQGMNLGWLGCQDLCKTLQAIFNEVEPAQKAFRKFEERRKKSAQQAIFRAELNMHMGRATSVPAFRNALVRLMLRRPLDRYLSQIFTMRGLGQWLV